MAEPVAVGVVGVGAIGRHHARIYGERPGCRLVAVHDIDAGRAREIAGRQGCEVAPSLEWLLERVEAVSLAAPTLEHEEIGLECLAAGCDLLVEKPIASDLTGADALIGAARESGRLLQVGHVERYNPAVEALLPLVRGPVFIEVDRLGSFARRSLEVDVFVDLMIHDIDLVNALVDARVAEIRSVGVPVLSDEIDIANARLEMAGGCIVNLTASRVSMNRVRKLRVFQPAAYFSVDYSEQSVAHYRLEHDSGGTPTISACPVAVERGEPLVNELEDFLECVVERRRPRVDGNAGRRALELALRIRDAVRPGPEAVGDGGTGT